MIYTCVCVYVCVCVCTLCDPMEPARFLCPWIFPGTNTGVSSLQFSVLLQRIFPTQGSNPGLLCLLHFGWSLFVCLFVCLPLCHLGSLYICKDFTTLTLLTLGGVIPFCGGCLARCRILTPLLTFAHWVPAASAPPPPLRLLWQTKMSQISSDVLWGGRVTRSLIVNYNFF